MTIPAVPAIPSSESSTPRRIRVLNLEEARFECTFGRGCDGMCCQNGRPPIYPHEVDALTACQPAVRPLLRPEAAAVIEHEGFLTRRVKDGAPTLRVVAGWCVFFNAGCALHRLGASEGDKFRYKPIACATFPLERYAPREWYVRQKGLYRERWDLWCLDPAVSQVPARASLHEELCVAEGDPRDLSVPR